MAISAGSTVAEVSRQIGVTQQSLRLGVYGHFASVHWSQVFGGPDPGVRLMDEEPELPFEDGSCPCLSICVGFFRCAKTPHNESRNRSQMCRHLHN